MVGQEIMLNRENFKSMKKILLSLFVACGSLMFWSCSEDSQDPSKVTYYITFEMNGEETMSIPVGTVFNDPGVVAMEGETDVTDGVKVDSNVNTDKIGVYTVSYSATNVDGFDSSIERTVVVYDPAITASMGGTYTIDPSKSTRSYAGTVSNFSNDFTVSLTELAPGIYQVSDFLGGWYDQGSGYGSAYAANGYCSLNADNTITMLSNFVAGWGDSVTSLDNASFDPTSNQVTWDATYTNNMLFHVVMNK